MNWIPGIKYGLNWFTEIKIRFELDPEPLTGTRRRATHTGISPSSRKPHHGEPWTLSCGLVVVVNIPFFVVYEYSTCMLLNIPHVNIYFVHTHTHKHTYHPKENNHSVAISIKVFFSNSISMFIVIKVPSYSIYLLYKFV